MRFFVGTSGFSYKEWKGNFYPEKTPAEEMLSFYARKFSTVEINSTFRGLPSASAVEAWGKQTPRPFRFALKAPQSITQYKRLNKVEALTDQFLQVASLLKSKCGPLLFQLPLNFKKDLPRLDAFLGYVDKRAKVTFEFRHESWFDEEVYKCLRKHSCELCVADTETLPDTGVVNTADWGYLRLRREKYTAKQLADWIAKIRSQKWKDVFVFFKHEDTGTGPVFATKFLELAGE